MFPRALRLSRMWGVEVRLDPSLIVFGVLIVWTFTTRFATAHGTPTALAMATAGMLAFLGSVLAHELAHALEARHRGMEVHGITLFLFGGVTEMHAQGQTPRDELAVAAVGPYVSLVCGAAFGLVATFAGDVLPAAAAGPVAEVAGLLGWLNVALAVFNLVPGAPLDGGRVLRAVLWMALRDRSRALTISVRAGQLLAVGLVVVAVRLATAGPDAWLAAGLAAVVGLFLFGAARQELRQHVLEELLTSHTVADLLGARTGPGTATLPDGLPAGGPELDRAGPDLPSVELDDDLHTLVDRLRGGHDAVRLEWRGTAVGTATKDQVADALAALRTGPAQGARR